MPIDQKDKALLAMLSQNSREPVAELARKLNLSRSTVKDRIARLEVKNIITGYTIRFSENYEAAQIQAHVLIGIDAKKSAHITRAIRNISAVKSLHAVNGIYDMVALVSAESTQMLDQVLDDIGGMEGIEKTVSSIILSTKFER